MRFPERARAGMNIMESFNELLTWCRATRITGVAGGRLVETPNGTMIHAPVAIAGRGVSAEDEKRFGFLGLSKNDDDAWQVRIAPGVVNYNRLSFQGTFEDREKGRYVKGEFPYVNTDGSGNLVRIDDETKPGLLIGDRDSGAIWLKCLQERCGNSTTTSEEIILTDRNDKPDGDSGHNYVLIAEFDIETTGSGSSESKKITNLYTFLQSDWEQPFLCEDADGSDSEDDSIDSSWPFSDESSDIDLSDNSGSSDGDSEADSDCEIQMTAQWTNVKDCFPVDTSIFPATSCFPKEYIFEVKVKFWFRGSFGGVECQKYAYGVKFQGGVTVGEEPGATADEYRWQNDVERTLKFKVDSPAACQYVQLPWRVKMFPAVSGFGGTPPESQGCCGREISGTALLQMSTSTGGVKVRKLPQVCGNACKCSGSSESSGSSGSSAE